MLWCVICGTGGASPSAVYAGGGSDPTLNALDARECAVPLLLRLRCDPVFSLARSRLPGGSLTRDTGTAASEGSGGGTGVLCSVRSGDGVPDGGRGASAGVGVRPPFLPGGVGGLGDRAPFAIRDGLFRGRGGRGGRGGNLEGDGGE